MSGFFVALNRATKVLQIYIYHRKTLDNLYGFKTKILSLSFSILFYVFMYSIYFFISLFCTNEYVCCCNKDLYKFINF